ncbi:MAG: histidine phosphatase family protein [Acetobacterales bacterium]
MRGFAAFVALAIVVLSPLPAAAEAGSGALWQALRAGGHIALVRHALAPGFGDPGDFRLGDCATQRNLSGEGRAQAERLGERFRVDGVEVARVLSSRWCRCLDTARLLGLGPVEEAPMFDSIHGRPPGADRQVRDMRAFLSRPFDGPSVVVVSHHANIGAATGNYPSSGEMVVVRPGADGGFDVLGSVATTAD